MKKLKKSSKKNKPTFNVVMVYGTAAVGKFTVANELQKMVNYKFIHNHDTFDLVRSLFERIDSNFDRVIEKIRFFLFQEISKANINVITTIMYSSSAISQTGLTDSAYMRKLESIVTKGGGRMCFIHLIADREVILKRVTGRSRKKFKKIKDVEKMKEILNRNDWRIMAPVKNNLQIDNTNLSPKKVAKIIKDYFEL